MFLPVYYVVSIRQGSHNPKRCIVSMCPLSPTLCAVRFTGSAGPSPPGLPSTETGTRPPGLSPRHWALAGPLGHMATNETLPVPSVGGSWQHPLSILSLLVRVRDGAVTAGPRDPLCSQYHQPRPHAPRCPPLAPSPTTTCVHPFATASVRARLTTAQWPETGTVTTCALTSESWAPFPWDKAPRAGRQFPFHQMYKDIVPPFSPSLTSKESSLISVVACHRRILGSSSPSPSVCFILLSAGHSFYICSL